MTIFLPSFISVFLFLAFLVPSVYAGQCQVNNISYNPPSPAINQNTIISGRTTYCGTSAEIRGNWSSDSNIASISNTFSINTSTGDFSANMVFSRSGSWDLRMVPQDTQFSPSDFLSPGISVSTTTINIPLYCQSIVLQNGEVDGTNSEIRIKTAQNSSGVYTIEDIKINQMELINTSGGGNQTVTTPLVCPSIGIVLGPVVNTSCGPNGSIASIFQSMAGSQGGSPGSTVTVNTKVTYQPTVVDYPIKGPPHSCPQVTTATTIPMTIHLSSPPNPNPTPNPGSGPVDTTTGGGELCNPETGAHGSHEKGGVWTAIGCIPTEPNLFVEKSLKFVAGIAGGIALLMMAMGAIKMILSQGNPDSLKDGQEQFTSAILGLLFVIFSVLLLKIIGVDVLAIPGFGYI